MKMLEYVFDDTNDYNKSGNNVGICCEIARSYYKDMAIRMNFNRQLVIINSKKQRYNFVMTGSV